MKRALAWLGGGAGVVLAIAGWLWLLRVYTAHLERDQRDREVTRAELATVRQETQRATLELARLGSAIQRHRAVADTHRVIRDSILQEHPIETAPAACAPWTLALTECQKEAVELRAALGLSDSARAAAGQTIARQDSALARARRALGKVDGKWLGFLPCPMIVIGGGTSAARPLDPQLQVTVGFPIIGKGQC